MRDQGVYVLLKVLVLPLRNMHNIILGDMSLKKNPQQTNQTQSEALRAAAGI